VVRGISGEYSGSRAGVAQSLIDQDATPSEKHPTTAHRAAGVKVGERTMDSTQWSGGSLTDRSAIGDVAIEGKIIEGNASRLYEARPDAASNTVVGLWLGKLIDLYDDRLDIRSVRIAVPAYPSSQGLCLFAVTYDDKYAAVSPQPLRFPLDLQSNRAIAGFKSSAYADVLTTYRVIDLAVSARAGDSCLSSASVPYLPAVVGSGRPSHLVALVSTGWRHTAAKLVGASGTFIETQCDRRFGPAYNKIPAYNKLCAFVLPNEGYGGTWSLDVTYDAGDAFERVAKLDVVLPE
jgi:hypothetical protein